MPDSILMPTVRALGVRIARSTPRWLLRSMYPDNRIRGAVWAIALSPGPELALDPDYPNSIANLRMGVVNFLPFEIHVRRISFQVVLDSFVIGDFERVPEESVAPMTHRELYLNASLSDSQVRLARGHLGGLPRPNPNCALIRVNGTLNYSNLLGEHRCTLQGDHRVQIHYGKNQ